MKYKKKANSDFTHIDPVCGMEVSYNTAPAVITHENKTYYFCADACRQTFEENPKLYIHKFNKAQ
ncbi:hypothetical protein MNBD_ALPHA02-2134 [hydrothermal vent metagenome]|uniref:TRASH domain-containing protein n=1 Tax=hydrothermal vent metagenome TaxID=652676 RepID=A0A3B0S0S4_9ZZZZ